MENKEEVIFPPLLRLPLETIEVIAHYLSVQDLSSCCATSRRMREMFNDNMIWKDRCDQKLADYLRTTECKVEPGFVSPEMKDSTLSPICEKRMSFMLVNHLWNNWRQGNYTEERIDSLVSSHYVGARHQSFLSSDFLIACFTEGFEILDVREHPPPRVFLYTISGFEHYLDIIPYNSSSILISNGLVEMSDRNVANHLYFQRKVFFFDESKRITEGAEVENKIPGLRKSPSDDMSDYCILGTYFMEIMCGDSTIHIWNLETGLKLKSEVCPLKQSSLWSFKTSETNNLILAIRQHSNCLLLGYSLTKLAFLPFRSETIDGVFFYSVYNDFVVINNNKHLIVYNYVTSETILKTQPTSVRHNIIKNNLIFLQNKRLNVFNFCTRLVEPLPIEGDIEWYSIIINKFLKLSIYNKGLEMWEISPLKKTLVLRKPVKVIEHVFNSIINQTFNRCVYMIDCYSFIINFW